jgi:hypothetical protein
MLVGCTRSSFQASKSTVHGNGETMALLVPTIIAKMPSTGTPCAAIQHSKRTLFLRLFNLLSISVTLRVPTEHTSLLQALSTLSVGSQPAKANTLPATHNR